jgi:hypothetical protein
MDFTHDPNFEAFWRRRKILEGQPQPQPQPPDPQPADTGYGDVTKRPGSSLPLQVPVSKVTLKCNASLISLKNSARTKLTHDPNFEAFRQRGKALQGQPKPKPSPADSDYGGVVKRPGLFTTSISGHDFNSNQTLLR